MKINDDWEVHDEVSGLRLRVIPGEKQDHLRIENLRPEADDCQRSRDFWFSKDGEFLGTGTLCVVDYEKSKDIDITQFLAGKRE